MARGAWGAGERSDDGSPVAAVGAAAQNKSVVATERDEAARATWRTTPAALAPAPLVVLDETSTHTAMTRARARARAPRGQRVWGQVPRNHGPNVTLLATLPPTGIAAPYVQEGAVDSRIGSASVEQVLVPTLRPGQTVMMANLNVHKGQQIRQAIAAAGGQVVLRSTSSPDFNPIESVLAQINTHLRQTAARSFDDLVLAIREAIDAVSPDDAQHSFRPCVFPLADQLL